MSKKKSSTKTNGNKKPSIKDRWESYFGKGTLDDFQRLCRDLSLPDDLPSKTRCRKVLSTVHVNIHQFLDAMDSGTDVRFFRSAAELSRYTMADRRRIYPRSSVPNGSPLRELLRLIIR